MAFFKKIIEKLKSRNEPLYYFYKNLHKNKRDSLEHFDRPEKDKQKSLKDRFLFSFNKIINEKNKIDERIKNGKIAIETYNSLNIYNQKRYKYQYNKIIDIAKLLDENYKIIRQKENQSKTLNADLFYAIKSYEGITRREIYLKFPLFSMSEIDIELDGLENDGIIKTESGKIFINYRG